MNINNLKQLEERGTLEYNDTVYFTVKEETVKYKVEPVWLGNIENTIQNDKIFKLLEINKYELAIEAYGHEFSPSDVEGTWPESNREDYPALTRLVKELYLIIEKPEPKYEPINNRFEILDL